MSDKAQWTKKLISNISTWNERKFGEVNFQLTQFLTGHGSFGTIYISIGYARNPPVSCAQNRLTLQSTIYFIVPFGTLKRTLWKLLSKPKYRRTTSSI